MNKQSVLIAILLLSIAACKSTEETENTVGDIAIDDKEEHKEAYMNELEALKKEIEATVETMIETTECEGANSCNAIAFGSKPCGGPWEYLIVPSSVDYGNLLIDKVEAYNNLEKEINEQFGLSSDCMFVEEPEVICKDGKCQAKN